MFPVHSSAAAIALTLLCASANAATVDAATQKRVVDTLGERIASHYVLPEQAAKVRALLRQRLDRGDYASITDAEAFADKLSGELDQITGDSHFGVYYFPQPVEADLAPPYSMKPDPARLQQRIASFGKSMTEGTADNFGFEKTERLAGNVGYVKISSFYDPSIASQATAYEMSRAADASALIIDLRGNGGGSPKAVALVSSYLFDDKPVHLNDAVTRGWNRTESIWTMPAPSDHRFGSTKPVFILIDAKTFSAAEGFAYTLQALKRATIVGEPSKGGAHGARGFKLDEHFLAMIPNRLTVNPVTRADWEKVGVKPDVRVEGADALAKALELAHAAARAPKAR